MRGRSVLLPARRSAAAPFNCAVRFSAWLKLNTYFSADGLINSSVCIVHFMSAFFHIFCCCYRRVLKSKKRKFFIACDCVLAWVRQNKADTKLMVYLSALAAANSPLLFFSGNKQTLKCSLCHFYVT